MECRHCGNKLTKIFADLGKPPLSNSYLTSTDLKEVEKCYPLRVMVCEECWLVQTEKFVEVKQIFTEDYAYFSSVSTSWLDHTCRYVDQITIMLALDKGSMVVEIGANDGYLLQYLLKKGIPCYGIEPTHSTAEAARKKNLDIIEDFFDAAKAKELADQKRQADLIIANNVLAHVPDINNFVKGFSILLNPNGVATFEFPHLLNLVQFNQFDTIYHEHYSYLSFTAALNIFTSNDLAVFKVEELSTHGGSLRLYAQRADSGKRAQENSVERLVEKEADAGMTTAAFYSGFQNRANAIKEDFNSFLQNAKKEGEKVVGYGAAAKGNTLMNFAGVDSDLISYVIDRNPAKRNKFLPGSKIPVVSEDRLKSDRPKYVVIFPWNLKEEIVEQLSYIREWNGKFLTSVPKLKVE